MGAPSGNPRRRPLLAVTLAGSALVGGLSACGTANGVSHYVGVGVLSAQRSAASPATRTEVFLRDCGSTVRLEIGRCALSAHWAPEEVTRVGNDPKQPAYRFGTIVVDSPQACSMDPGEGGVVLHVSSGTARVERSRAVEVDLAGTLGDSSSNGGAASFSFRAFPDGPPLPLECTPAP
jgi:hypothetical protein